MKKVICLAVIFLLLTSYSFAIEGVQTLEKVTNNTMINGTTWTWTPDITSQAKINSISVVTRTNCTEYITIYLDSQNGASYDCVLNATSGSYESSYDRFQNSRYYFWQPDYDFILEKDDNLKITITSDGHVATQWFTVTVKGEIQ